MQHEITRAIPLLNDAGNLTEPGYAKKLLPVYRRKDIKANALRIKEWDYYCVNNGRFALCLTIADNGYMGLDSISLLDFENGWEITNSPMSLMPMGKVGLPASSKVGDVKVEKKDYTMSFRNDGKTLSVLREVYENLGGAHPMITYQAETFDVASQGRLLLGDLFSVAEDAYSARLQDMILAQMDQKETETGVLYYDFAREQLMTLHDSLDFALTEDCLLIFYNEYALAPHAAGPQHFYLPLSDLSDILLPQYVTE